MTRAREAGIVEQLTKLAHDTKNSLAPEHVRKLASWVARQCTKDSKRETESMEVDTEASEQEMVRKRKAEAAKARQAKIMAQMKANQAKFATDNKEEMDKMKENQEDQKEASHCSQESDTVCLGPGLTTRADTPHNYTCILCQVRNFISLYL